MVTSSGHLKVKQVKEALVRQPLGGLKSETPNKSNSSLVVMYKMNDCKLVFGVDLCVFLHHLPSATFYVRENCLKIYSTSHFKK